MEESYETFEEELGTSRTNPPPQKPVRQISRPEMYTTRKIREEMVQAPREPRAEAKTLPEEATLYTTASLHKTLSIQNLTQMETPWENVTLNRCLFVAITILVLTSGFQRLHETLRGEGTAGQEEEVGLRVRRSGTLRHREKPPGAETSLWDVIFWWLPDLDDDEEDDEEDEDDGDRQVRRGHSMKKATARGSRGFRNKPMLDKNIMKQKGRKSKDKRTKKARDEKNKGKKEREKRMELEAADNEEANEGDDQNEADEVLKNNKKL